MNKVFKVIWSKTKNCYVVASELAKSHTKAPSKNGISRMLVCSVLACVCSFGAVMPVFADGYTAGGATTAVDTSIAIGNGTSVSAPDSIAIGDGITIAQTDGDGKIIVLGDNITTGWGVNNTILIGSGISAAGDVLD